MTQFSYNFFNHDKTTTIKTGLIEYGTIPKSTITSCYFCYCYFACTYPYVTNHCTIEEYAHHILNHIANDDKVPKQLIQHIYDQLYIKSFGLDKFDCFLSNE